MKLLFLAIQSYLLSQLSNVNYIRMWNNQLDRLLNGEQQSDFALMDENGDTPALLIELVGPANIEMLGNGDQIYQDLVIRVHILHQFYNANDGTMDQDLPVLDIAENIYKAFNDWMPDTMTINGVVYQIPVGVMNRTGENWDYDHPDVYHFIQEYTTNWVDSNRNKPINGTLSDKNATIELVVIKGDNETTNEYYYAA